MALTLSLSESGFHVLDLGGGSGMLPCAGLPPAKISASSTRCSHPRYLPMASGSLVMMPVQRVLVVKNILTLYGTLSFLKAELFMVIG